MGNGADMEIPQLLSFGDAISKPLANVCHHDAHLLHVMFRLSSSVLREPRQRRSAFQKAFAKLEQG